MDEQQLNLTAKIATQALLVSLAAQMHLVQRLSIALLESGTLSPEQTASFVRSAADIAGQNDSTDLGKMFTKPISFYFQALNEFARAIEDRNHSSEA